MIGLPAGLLFVALGAPDCALPAPAGAADPEGARAYLEVGDEERDRGSEEAAFQAYREALRRDPSSAGARARVLEMCAVAAVEEGRHVDAAKLLEPLYRERPEPSTALMYGIALYELGEDRKARPLLEEAARNPSIREAATLFLGLLLLRAGDAEAAATLFDQVNAGSRPELTLAAQDLSALARRESRLAVSATLDTGYDNNVDQAPDRTVVTGLSGDVLYGARASALLRPTGERGLQATASLGYRDQLEIDGFDLLWAAGALGHTWGAGARLLRIEYAYDHLWLGGRPFLSAHQLSAAGRVELGAMELSGSYAARLEAFLPSTVQHYSGLVQDAAVGLGLALGGWAVLAAGYRGQLDQSVEPWAGWREHGPRLQLMARLGGARAGLQGEITFRRYLAPDLPPHSFLREDLYLDAELSLESDVSREVTLFVEVGARKAFSNESLLEYTRFAGRAGLIYTTGLW
jgi:tetratricopeptide (TPR) repeat protein